MAGPGEDDKLAENWNPGSGADGEVSSDWAAMLETEPSRPQAGGGADRVLNQDEIDSLLGFDAKTSASVELTGVQALINSALVSLSLIHI